MAPTQAEPEQEINHAAFRHQRESCRRCGGNGFTPCWFLVTYHWQSFRRKKSVRLAVTTQIEADEFAGRIEAAPVGGDYQDLVRAVDVCGCHAPIAEATYR